MYSPVRHMTEGYGKYKGLDRLDNWWDTRDYSTELPLDCTYINLLVWYLQSRSNVYCAFEMG